MIDRSRPVARGSGPSTRPARARRPSTAPRDEAARERSDGGRPRWETRAAGDDDDDRSNERTNGEPGVRPEPKDGEVRARAIGRSGARAWTVDAEDSFASRRSVDAVEARDGRGVRRARGVAERERGARDACAEEKARDARDLGGVCARATGVGEDEGAREEGCRDNASRGSRWSGARCGNFRRRSMSVRWRRVIRG